MVNKYFGCSGCFIAIIGITAVMLIALLVGGGDGNRNTSTSTTIATPPPDIRPSNAEVHNERVAAAVPPERTAVKNEGVATAAPPEKVIPETFEEKLSALPAVERAYAMAKLNGQLSFVETLAGKWAAAEQGKVYLQADVVKVMQLVASDQILATYETGEFESHRVLLSGIDTSNLVSDQSCRFSGAWIRSSNESYQTVLGANNTVPHWINFSTSDADELLARKPAIDAAVQEAEAARKEAEFLAAMVTKYGFDVRTTTLEQIDSGQEIIFEEDRHEQVQDRFVAWGEIFWTENIPAGYIYCVALTQAGEVLGMSRSIETQEVKAEKKRRIRAVFEDLQPGEVDVVKAVCFEAP